MTKKTGRRAFLKGSLLTPAAAALTANAANAQGAEPKDEAKAKPEPLAQGDILGMKVSRLLLGGNLLTHYTHSRDLQYVYNLAANYNTESKILDTLGLAEEHGINTLVVHTVPWCLDILRKHRRDNGGYMQWIICPTAPVKPGVREYREQVARLVNDGTEAIYLWGVHSDNLVAQGKVDLIAEAVETAKNLGIPSGVGAHDLRVVVECEKQGIEPDFYIKTFHHHRYKTAPKPEEINGPYNEFPGYWCSDPDETREVMSKVKKPWIAFKVMAAGAIPPKDAFRWAFESGADHVLAGMFDFEIEEDAGLIREAFNGVQRSRPWFS